jgi:hypothetical protein
LVWSVDLSASRSTIQQGRDSAMKFIMLLKAEINPGVLLNEGFTTGGRHQ